MPYVESGDDRFLCRKCGLLDTLHDLHGPDICVVVARNEPELEHGHWGMEDNGIYNYHYEDEAENLGVMDDKVQA